MNVRECLQRFDRYTGPTQKVDLASIRPGDVVAFRTYRRHYRFTATVRLVLADGSGLTLVTPDREPTVPVSSLVAHFPNPSAD